MPTEKHILGIRHHGPGSAKHVAAYLEAVKPEIILVEGPPDADHMLQWVAHEELEPPVALLVFNPDDPKLSVFYPFAVFSPEWQAILYARRNNITVRFMDLPVAHSFALKKEQWERANENTDQDAPQAIDESGNDTAEDAPPEIPIEEMPRSFRRDPIAYLAEAAGYDDGEKWWEQTFENRVSDEAVFEAVAEAMTELRQTIGQPYERHEAMREAWMRKTIRQAEREMFQSIAVICGAWHVPALQTMPPQKEDNELLKGLPKIKTDCTWIPWTYSRLSYDSGYGAGILSPGWYHHLWDHHTDDGTRWIAKVAQLFREKQMDTSVAHVIEAVRLAGTLAAIRNRSKVSLDELNEATLSVLCMGDSILLQLINRELIVSNRIGSVPQEIPKPPLLLDIEKQQKKLRLSPTADSKEYQLDLRKDTDLERSILLHRMLLLGIEWGHELHARGKGTFKENWRLQWEPGFSVDIIEKGSWGNTLLEAVTQFVIHTAAGSGSLSDVSEMLVKALPADLPEAVNALTACINNLAAGSVEVEQLMKAVPGLVHVSRYGNVRKTDSEIVAAMARGMITRITVGLPVSCTNIDADAAESLGELIRKMNEAIQLMDEEASTNEWQLALQIIATNTNTVPVIAGYATRLVYDCRLLTGEALVEQFSFAMSPIQAPATAAAWLEGFLKGSGTILLLDNDLWLIIDNWLVSLNEETFKNVLPLLRRTFANFSSAERRKLGEKAKTGTNGRENTKNAANEPEFDHSRALGAIPAVLQLFNLKLPVA